MAVVGTGVCSNEHQLANEGAVQRCSVLSQDGLLTYPHVARDTEVAAVRSMKPLGESEWLRVQELEFGHDN